jgi:hypothetical protein
LLTNAFALVKRNDAFGMDGFAGKAIRERGVGVEVGDSRVLGKFAGTPSAPPPPLGQGHQKQSLAN